MNLKIEDLELEDADITISEGTMLKVSEAEQEKLQEELINNKTYVKNIVEYQ